MAREREPRRGAPGEEGPSTLARAMAQSQMGLQLVAPPLGLGAIGWFLDRRFGTAPWILLAGLVLGVVGGMVNFIHAALHPPGEPR